MTKRLVVRWKNLLPPSLKGGGYEHLSGPTWTPISIEEVHGFKGLVIWSPLDGQGVKI